MFIYILSILILSTLQVVWLSRRDDENSEKHGYRQIFIANINY